MNSERLNGGERRMELEPLRPPAGWRVLVPGLPHWYWDQRDQALIFFGFASSAILIGVFLWGTWLSLLLLGFAYVAHAVSASDAIKQAAFPKFNPMVPPLAAFLGLGVICYAPLMILGSMFAWPVVADRRSGDGYWVNRWAYGVDAGPQHGETIWLRGTERTGPRLARVVAAEGQRVRWAENRLHVDDRPAPAAADQADAVSHALEMTIPAEHVLVAFVDDLAEPFGNLAGWEIVAHEEVHGRAWARSYPVWDRQLLR